MKKILDYLLFLETFQKYTKGNEAILWFQILVIRDMLESFRFIPILPRHLLSEIDLNARSSLKILIKYKRFLLLFYGHESRV